tara:strand:- start:416 stop:1558 length:1143 start_codon:yes stop_codon:yes gene_type:complete
MVSKGWFPCCDKCVMHSDNFDRADSDSLGIEWSEDIGDIDIKDEGACPTTDNSIATSTIYERHPTEHGQVIRANITITEIDVEGRIMGGVVVNEASDLWWYAQLKLHSAYEHRLSLYHYNEAEGHTEHGSTVTLPVSQNSKVAVELCLVPESPISDYGIVTATASCGAAVAQVKSERVLLVTYEKAGMGCGQAPTTVGDLRIDDWQGMRSSMDNVVQNCPDCSGTGVTRYCTSCTDDEAPQYVLVDITGITDLIGGNCCGPTATTGFNTAHLAQFDVVSASCTGYPPIADCYWTSPHQVGCSGTPAHPWKFVCLMVNYDSGSNQTTIEVKLQANGNRVTYRKVVSGKADCKGWDQFDVDTIVTNDSNCDYTGSKAMLSAI